MLDQLKALWSLIVGSRLIVEGAGRTFAKAPMWLAVLLVLASLRLAVITVLLMIAFGLRPRIAKA